MRQPEDSRNSSIEEDSRLIHRSQSMIERTNLSRGSPGSDGNVSRGSPGSDGDLSRGSPGSDGDSVVNHPNTSDNGGSSSNVARGETPCSDADSTKNHPGMSSAESDTGVTPSFDKRSENGSVMVDDEDRENVSWAWCCYCPSVDSILHA